MKIDRIFDESLVREILTADDMWATIAEDGQDKESFSVDVNSDCWLLVSDDEPIALYNYHPMNAVTVYIHAHVIMSKRKQYSTITGKMALDWLWKNSNYSKVIAMVPSIYPNVRDFTLSFGFVEEGCLVNSYLKGGELVDQWIFGLERQKEAKAA